jgi:hypothetical protein
VRLAVVLALVAAAAAGCGADDRRPATRSGAAPDTAAHAREVERNPYALTCGDLANQPKSPETQRLVIRAEFALARDPGLRQRARAMTENRVGRSVYWALTELCKGRDASFQPARQAVAAVRRGEYLVQPRPKKWSEPERYWNAQDR